MSSYMIDVRLFHGLKFDGADETILESVRTVRHIYLYLDHDVQKFPYRLLSRYCNALLSVCAATNTTEYAGWGVLQPVNTSYIHQKIFALPHALTFTELMRCSYCTSLPECSSCISEAINIKRVIVVAWTILCSITQYAAPNMPIGSYTRKVECLTWKNSVVWRLVIRLGCTSSI